MIIRPQFWPTAMMLPALALLIGLGVWQLHRLEWKEGLIAAAHNRSTAAPISLDKALAEYPNTLKYRHVAVRGTFDHAHEVYLFEQPEGEDEPGYIVITPLIRPGARPVLVERGYVPESKRLPAARAEGQVTGEVTVTGLIRLPQAGTIFTPDPDLNKRIWYKRDIAAMARAAGAADALPVSVAADPAPNPGGWPKGGMTRLRFRNHHLGYALTWFALAVVLVAVYVFHHHANGYLRWRS